MLATLSLTLPARPELHGAIERRHHLGPARPEGVESPCLDQALDHSFVEQPQVDAFTELKDVVKAT